MQVVLAAPEDARSFDNIEVAGRPHNKRLQGRMVQWLYRQLCRAGSGMAMTMNTPMEKMTGGTLPAATWHEVMEYAHQGN